MIDGLRNKITCGDSLPILRSLPDCSIPMFVTSPPYNMGGVSMGGKWKNPALANGYAEYKDRMPYGNYVAWQRQYLAEMVRLIPDDGCIFYNHKWRIKDGLLLDRNEIVRGFPVRQIIIWKRAGGFNFNDDYFLPTFEVIYLIVKRRKAPFRLVPKACSLTDVWVFPQEQNNPHPAPFPYRLPYRCINACKLPLVCDPFGGSGTTAKAAQALGRDFIHIDSSEEYCNQARKRLGPSVFRRRRPSHVLPES